MLTLITATLNAARHLERALASAASQPGANQLIVVDGGSQDRTVEIARRYPDVETVVAPGSSIYEAWNIGIDRARGEAVMFLNADDELAPEATGRVESLFMTQPNAEIVAGDAALLDVDQPDMPPVILSAAPSGALEVAQLASGVPAINAMAFRLSLFARYGRFETSYCVAGDRAFLLRLALLATPPRVARTASVLYRYHSHAGSLTLRRSLEQRLRIARDHIALSRAFLAHEPPPSAALWLRHMRRREAAIATLRCLAAGEAVAAWEFAKNLW